MADNNLPTAHDGFGYEQLINNISSLWDNAKAKAFAAVNTELLEANWHTGKYIVEYEQRTLLLPQRYCLNG